MIPSFNIIFGYPGEGDKERRETVSFMMDICQKFPGSGVLDQHLYSISAVPHLSSGSGFGIDVPKTLEDWVKYFPAIPSYPGLTAKTINGCRPCGTICELHLTGRRSRQMARPFRQSSTASHCVSGAVPA